MRLLALDPSSTCTGYALMDGTGKLIEAGRFRHQNQRAEPICRIASMALDVQLFIRDKTPNTIVVEITSGKVGLRRHHGAGAGLAVYGMAVGAIWWACMSTPNKGNVEYVTENEWTEGRPKSRRQAEVMLSCPEYRRLKAKDPGGDIADAIGTGLWWLSHELVEKMCPHLRRK